MPGSLGTQDQSPAKSPLSSTSPLNPASSCSKENQLSSEGSKSPVAFADFEHFPQEVDVFSAQLLPEHLAWQAT